MDKAQFWLQRSKFVWLFPLTNTIVGLDQQSAPKQLINEVPSHVVLVNNKVGAGIWNKFNWQFYIFQIQFKLIDVHSYENIDKMACFSKAIDLHCIYKPTWCVSLKYFPIRQLLRGRRKIYCLYIFPLVPLVCLSVCPLAACKTSDGVASRKFSAESHWESMTALSYRRIEALHLMLHFQYFGKMI